LIGAFVLAGFVGGRVGLAEGATPTPDVPAAGLCIATAPSFDRLNAAILDNDGATPEPQRTPGVVPAGTPASTDIAAAVTATVRELVACFNAGAPLRAYGLYTDAYLHRLFARQGPFSRASYDGYATPEPEPDVAKHTAILAIRDIRVFADGSAGATVTLHYASIPVPKTFFFTFVRNGDGWLIDDILGELGFSVG
jgi:hypothetical protein